MPRADPEGEGRRPARFPMMELTNANVALLAELARSRYSHAIGEGETEVDAWKTVAVVIASAVNAGKITEYLRAPQRPAIVSRPPK